MLSETADLMEISSEDPFRIRSYRTAAGVIEGHPEQLSAILKDPAKKLTDIPGIGKGIAAVVAEIEERGSFERRDEMLGKYPASLLELLSIQGLGPKSIRLLYDTYKVQSIDDLERVCREQKLRELPRMGAKLEEKVLRSIASYRQRQGRFLLSLRGAGGGGIDGVPERGAGRREGDAGGEFAAREGNGRRSGFAGHGTGGGGGAGEIRGASEGA